jgi:hypothetical protein
MLDTKESQINATPQEKGIGNAAGWLSFPVHEMLSRPEGVKLLARVEDTYRKLEALTNNGQGSDRTRALIALKAYSRALELLETIHDMQERSRLGSK